MLQWRRAPRPHPAGECSSGLPDGGTWSWTWSPGSCPSGCWSAVASVFERRRTVKANATTVTRVTRAAGRNFEATLHVVADAGRCYADPTAMDGATPRVSVPAGVLAVLCGLVAGLLTFAACAALWRAGQNHLAGGTAESILL